MNSVIFRLPIKLQKSLKAPGFSGIVTAKIDSLSSPISALSETKPKRSKFIFAPEAVATKVFESTLFFLIYDFTPATAKAPAGSKIDLVSSNTSLIAAHISSLSTIIISSTYC